MTKYTHNDILGFQCTAYSLGLSGPDAFFNLPYEVLATICNGVGAEGSMTEPILSLIFRHYKASASIHDVRYELGGDDVDRLYADKEFLNNMRLQWAEHWGLLRWFRPRARAERATLMAAYTAVRRCGSTHFNYRERERPTEETV